MFNQTKTYLKLIPVGVLLISLALTGKALADQAPEAQSADSDQQFQTLINWNEEVQATLSSKMDKKLEQEMQALANNQTEQQPANIKQLADSTGRDVVLIKADTNRDQIKALSTTPVVVIIDRKELCLLNI